MYDVQQTERQTILKQFGRTEKTAKDDIQDIKKWITQKNYPEIMGDVEILNFLQLNKFDIEKAKQRIDSYYTVRSKIPDIFGNSNPKLPHMQHVFETSYIFSHLKALDGSGRVCFIKMKKPNTYAPVDMLKLFFSLYEVRLHEDCMVTDTLVVDMDNLTFRDVIKVTPRLAYRAVSVYKNVFALRVKAIHLLNSPLYVSVWLTIFKLLLKQKIFDRIYVHRDSEVMRELFSNEVLPKEYGGLGMSLTQLNEMAKQKLEEYENRFDMLDRITKQ